MGESTYCVADQACIGGAYWRDIVAGSRWYGTFGVVDLDLGSCLIMRSSCGSNVLSRNERRVGKGAGIGVLRAVLEPVELAAEHQTSASARVRDHDR